MTFASLQKWFLGLAGVTGGAWAAVRYGYLDSMLGSPPKDSQVVEDFLAPHRARAPVML